MNEGRREEEREEEEREEEGMEGGEKELRVKRVKCGYT